MYSLITGATSGIGESIAYMMADAGENLIIVGRNEEKLKRLQSFIREAYNVKVQACVVDVTKVHQVDRMIAWIKDEGLQIDTLVNNAGMGDFGPFFESNLMKQMEMIDVNIKGFTYLLGKIESCLAGRKRILQVASTAAFAPGPYMSVYYATKAYVVSLSLALKHEAKRKGIQVSILCPGPTKTEFQQRAKMKKSKFVSLFAMTPEKVAEVACDGLNEGKTFIIPGLINKLSVGLMLMLPMGLSAKLVACTQKEQ